MSPGSSLPERCRRVARALAVASLAALTGCSPASPCHRGDRRPCERTTDGGYTQGGYQTCEATSTWSECVPVGACVSPDGGSLALYTRCTGNEACGPPDCAVCGNYAGVRNPGAFGICYPFCQVDLDCAPTTPSAGVTPRCVLGQCTLLCHASSTCPNDTQCLGWNDTATATMYPVFDGLCE